MGSDATPGYGAQLGYGTDGNSYTSILQTVDLGGPEPEVGAVGITNNDSPDNTKEYMPGMVEPGEMEFEVVYKKSVCAAVYALHGDGVTYFWKLTYPDGSHWTFKGFVTTFGTEAPTEEGAMKNTVGIKLTNKPVYTPGA